MCRRRSAVLEAAACACPCSCLWSARLSFAAVPGNVRGSCAGPLMQGSATYSVHKAAHGNSKKFQQIWTTCGARYPHILPRIQLATAEAAQAFVHILQASEKEAA